MKGNIEGNATEFKFFQDVEQMDDFKEQMKGRAKLTPIQLYKPLAVSFASSKKDELGFGAAARGIATPAYFNIPVDAEYDTEAETIKIFFVGILSFQAKYAVRIGKTTKAILRA